VAKKPGIEVGDEVFLQVDVVRVDIVEVKNAPKSRSRSTLFDKPD
jgi:hypothetical protein